MKQLLEASFWKACQPHFEGAVVSFKCCRGTNAMQFRAWHESKPQVTPPKLELCAQWTSPHSPPLQCYAVFWCTVLASIDRCTKLQLCRCSKKTAISVVDCLFRYSVVHCPDLLASVCWISTDGAPGGKEQLAFFIFVPRMHLWYWWKRTSI